MVAVFKERLRELDPGYATFEELQTLQVNLGNLCNLRCAHCHVNASPAGDRIMGPEVMEKIVGFLSRRPGITLDITGGCPEMNPHFCFLVEGTRGHSPRRMVRSNLTILTEPGMEWLPPFYRDQELVVIASLPCYLEENVDRQRGPGVFGRSIDALRTLNVLGYGVTLELNLVYNPGGPFIPGSQRELEEAYRAELLTRYGIRFNNLYTIANAPIGRFREHLEATDTYERYLTTLATRFNPDAAPAIMCRTLVSIDWQGILYNCDFNQAIGQPITGSNGTILTIDNLDEAATTGTELVLAQHCYCCTAGEGSSCTGSLA
ncbi:Antilisterial bacteriocin subtilosin biosynthesis protein AlbA [uncultured bacterium]|nr:Antilisterial bacteriocin subtilosin biosynthesis protein AlbA [uncultured bacterium]